MDEIDSYTLYSPLGLTIPSKEMHQNFKQLTAEMEVFVNASDTPTHEQLDSARSLLAKVVDEFAELPKCDGVFHGEGCAELFACLPPGMQRTIMADALANINSSMQGFLRVRMMREGEVDAEDPMAAVIRALAAAFRQPPPR